MVPAFCADSLVRRGPSPRGSFPSKQQSAPTVGRPARREGRRRKETRVMKRYGSILRSLTILVLTAGSVAAAETRYAVTDLGTLTGPRGNSWALGINASGQIVGASDARVDIFPYTFAAHAYLYDDGQMSDLGTLDGGLTSAAWGINASGEVVGVSDAPGRPGLESRAFLYSGGV